jgi:hypothetical protein
MNASMRSYLTKRLQSPWLYRGADAMARTDISSTQKNYALTLRRQLVERLQQEVEPTASMFATPIAGEFYLIACELRRELRRTHRAALRLANKVTA